MGTKAEQAIVDEFGEGVIRFVRDPMCECLVELLRGNPDFNYYKDHKDKCHKLGLTDDQRIVLQEVVADLIDSAIRGVLFELYGVELIFTSKSGEKLDLVKASDGMHGDYGFANDPEDTGWVNTFSKYDRYLRLRSGNRSEDG